MSDIDEFDAIPDEFEGLNFDAVPALAIPDTNSTTTNNPGPSLPRPASAASSTQYSCDDDIDESYLVAIDALENRLGESPNAVNSPVPQSNAQLIAPETSCLSRFFGPPSAPTSDPAPGQVITSSHSSKPVAREKLAHTDFSAPTARKRDRASSSGPVSPPSAKKGKNKVDPNDGVRKILEGFEDEMTCPICCDIFVAAHLGNPCGHSFCGDCGWEWISKNKRSPTCAVCRTKLARSAPMIPNFALDNTVNRHILALASSGQAEWQTGGIRIKEWDLKKEKWKRDSEVRAAEAAQKQRPRAGRQTREEPVYLNNDADLAAWLVPDNEVEFVDDDSDYEADELSAMDTTNRLRSRPRRDRGQGQR